jgi:hypothetical protein
MAPIDLTARRFGNEQSPYLLSTTDWRKVNEFAQGALRLPTDEGPLRQSIGYRCSGPGGGCPRPPIEDRCGRLALAILFFLRLVR